MIKFIELQYLTVKIKKIRLAHGGRPINVSHKPFNKVVYNYIVGTIFITHLLAYCCNKIKSQVLLKYIQWDY
jgi:hypothetical protein